MLQALFLSLPRSLSLSLPLVLHQHHMGPRLVPLPRGVAAALYLQQPSVRYRSWWSVRAGGAVQAKVRCAVILPQPVQSVTVPVQQSSKTCTRPQLWASRVSWVPKRHSRQIYPDCQPSWPVPLPCPTRPPWAWTTLYYVGTHGGVPWLTSAFVHLLSFCSSKLEDL